MKRILAVNFFPAFTPATNGGQARLFNFYQALSAYHAITLLTSSHASVPEERIHHGINFIERRVPKDNHFIKEWERWHQISSGGDMSGPVIAAASKRPTLFHQCMLEESERADIIIHDCPFTEGYDLTRGLDGKLRVYNAYNCESRLYRQLHPAPESKAIHDLVERAERAILRDCDLVLYCEEGDLATFRKMEPGAKFEATYTPNGTLLTPFVTQDRPREQPARNAVFMGSAHPPNTAAAKFIVEALAPKFPEIKFRFIGNCLPDGIYPSNVERNGVVSEHRKREILNTSDLALNPMASGSGSNVKVLDYFSNLVPVISTDFGMRGIHATAGLHYIASSINEFEETLRQAMADPAALRRMAVSANHLATERYSWSGIAASVAPVLTRLANAKLLQPTEQHLLVLNDYDSFATIGGGATRTRGLYAVASTQTRVVFISFSASDRLERTTQTDGLVRIGVPKTQDHLNDEDGLGKMFHVSCNDIIASRHCRDNLILDKLYKLLRNRASMVIAEHCYLAPLPLSYGDRFVYSSQNVEIQLKRRILAGHPLGDDLLRYLDNLERHTVSRAAATIAVCEEDGDAFQRMASTTGAVMVIRNGAEQLPPDQDVAAAIASLRERPISRSAVFVGSAHMPNIEAALFIRSQLAEDCPDVQFHIIGSVCNGLAKMSNPPNLKLWGEVDEATKTAVMTSCAIAISPVTSGGGSNIKLADYMAHGLFVVTTDFGRRGYPPSVNEHLLTSELKSFAKAVSEALLVDSSEQSDGRVRRQALFLRELSMKSAGDQFARLLAVMKKPTRRVLYVTYRYTSPALGGAEAMLLDLVRALGQSGDFLVDVVAPEVSSMRNRLRFSEEYAFDVPTALKNVPNLRHRRFPLDESTADETENAANRLNIMWQAQVAFERELSQALRTHYAKPGLAWGWGEVSGQPGSERRWAYASCGAYFEENTSVVVSGSTQRPIVISITDESGALILRNSIEAGEFSLALSIKAAGVIEFNTSREAEPLSADPRPLGFLLHQLQIDGTPFDLAHGLISQEILKTFSASEVFEFLAGAAEASRFALGTRLTDVRGPFSSKLEAFIENHVDEYDLVLTHNNVFRPPVEAINAAARKGVPSILIPHAHFDDDFYHFPDVLDSARAATLVLAAPQAACDFLTRRGCNVRYLPAALDTHEAFGTNDIQEFRALYGSERPFVLILGRKASAKNYRQAISEVERFNNLYGPLDVVLIGPDDDREPIHSKVATYLGQQPREVVRGALLSCLALVNLSSSESFGIVLVEAWLAGKPVIVNQECAAFKDMAIHDWNAQLVPPEGVAEAVRRLQQDAAFCKRLADNGRITAARFDYSAVAKQFLEFCNEAILQNH